jgi:diguanylate cyclase (GGDEF)-like protein
MVAVSAGAHDALVLSPSWPTPTRLRRSVPPSVRRRVHAAERHAMRRAVSVGSWLLAGLLTIDTVVNVSIGTPGAVALLPVEVAGAAIATVIGWTARRPAIRAEGLALLVMLLVFGTALFGMAVMPAGRVLAAAQLATILVGAGLFLPWDRRWHLASLLATIGLTVAFVLGPLGTVVAGDRLNLLVAVLMASATSFIGHGIWQARLRRMLVQQFELRRLSRYAQRQEAHASELNRELNRVARRDQLTGVGNRLAFDEAIARLLDQGERLRPMRFALVLFDIDHFKAYNDEHGHLAGDAALGRLGEILRRATRGTDLAFRFGGEEFLLLLPEVELPGAIVVAERVASAVEDATTGVPPFTISGGVALCDPADGRDPGPLLRRADAALYMAKRSGRNRIAADELSVAMQRQSIASA